MFFELGTITVEDLLRRAVSKDTKVAFTTTEFTEELGRIVGEKFPCVVEISTNLQLIGADGSSNGFVEAVKAQAPSLRKVWLSGGECLTLSE
jgi:hypothetical protein